MGHLRMLPDLSKSLSIYKALLLKWSKAINLVAPSTLSDIDVRHFEDSLQILPHLPDGARILFDFGSGAGFPALVLAMARPELEVHLFESDQRKCSFLSTVSRETFVPVLIHNDRVENVNKESLPQPDAITARALASLSELLQLSRLWWDNCSNSPILIFPKGERADEEIAVARELFDFSVEKVPSRTDPKASLLILSGVRLRS